MGAIITVENIGKKYVIGHRQQRGRVTFRDALVNTGQRLWQRVSQPLRLGSTGMDLEEIWALKDVCFEVHEGERLGIIGRNGAGKSTLLKILSRITAPSTGRVHLRGRVSSLLEVGTGFHPELTGRENIFLNGAILGMTRQEIKTKFEEIVAFAEIEKFLDTPVKRYSSGMYVRLAFAVAAHLEPEILIVDEVLAVGDAAFQKKCLGKMQDVAQEGRTILFVSHNMTMVQSLCSQAMVLWNGQCSYRGDVHTAVDSYVRQEPTTGMEQERRIHGLIQSVRLSNGDGRPVDTYAIGEPIHVAIDLDARCTPLQRPTVGIGIDNSLGLRVCTVGTYFSTEPLPPLDRRTVVICEIPSPVLAPGQYTLKVAVGGNIHENIEELEVAARFNIVPSDYFGNGRLPTSSQGVVVTRAHWRLLDQCGEANDN